MPPILPSLDQLRQTRTYLQSSPNQRLEMESRLNADMQSQAAPALSPAPGQGGLVNTLSQPPVQQHNLLPQAPQPSRQPLVDTSFGLPSERVYQQAEERQRQQQARPAALLPKNPADLSFQAKQPERTLGGSLGDIGVTALKGAVGLPQAFVGLADIPTGGRVGRGFEKLGYKPGETQEILSGWYSPAQKYAEEQVQQAEGFIPTLKAAVQNPSTIARAVGESAPLMLGGAGIARGILSKAPMLARIAPKLGTTAEVLAGAIGEGAIGAGALAESIREQTEDGLLTPQQAGAALAGGVGTALFSAAGGRLAQKLGIDDIDTLLAGGRFKKPDQVAKAIVAGGISEGLFEEMPQEMQETVWQNAATGRPLLEGAAEAGAQALLAGAAMGSGANIIAGAAGQEPVTDDQGGTTADTQPVTPQSPVTDTGTASEMIEKLDLALGTGQLNPDDPAQSGVIDSVREQMRAVAESPSPEVQEVVAQNRDVLELIGALEPETRRGTAQQQFDDDEQPVREPQTDFQETGEPQFDEEVALARAQSIQPKDRTKEEAQLVKEYQERVEAEELAIRRARAIDDQYRTPEEREIVKTAEQREKEGYAKEEFKTGQTEAAQEEATAAGPGVQEKISGATIDTLSGVVDFKNTSLDELQGIVRKVQDTPFEQLTDQEKMVAEAIGIASGKAEKQAIPDAQGTTLTFADVASRSKKNKKELVRSESSIREYAIKNVLPKIKATLNDQQQRLLLDEIVSHERNIDIIKLGYTPSGEANLQKRLKGAAMQHAAAKRGIIQGDSLDPVEGGLTDKELASKVKRLSGNYIGKNVVTPDGNAKVTGNPFGRVAVEFSDGSKKTYDKESISPGENDNQGGVPPQQPPVDTPEGDGKPEKRGRKELLEPITEKEDTPQLDTEKRTRYLGEKEDRTARTESKRRQIGEAKKFQEARRDPEKHTPITEQRNYKENLPANTERLMNITAERYRTFNDAQASVDENKEHLVKLFDKAGTDSITVTVDGQEFTVKRPLPNKEQIIMNQAGRDALDALKQKYKDAGLLSFDYDRGVTLMVQPAVAGKSKAAAYGPKSLEAAAREHVRFMRDFFEARLAKDAVRKRIKENILPELENNGIDHVWTNSKKDTTFWVRRSDAKFKVEPEERAEQYSEERKEITEGRVPAFVKKVVPGKLGTAGSGVSEGKVLGLKKGEKAERQAIAEAELDQILKSISGTQLPKGQQADIMGELTKQFGRGVLAQQKRGVFEIVSSEKMASRFVDVSKAKKSVKDLLSLISAKWGEEGVELKLLHDLQGNIVLDKIVVPEKNRRSGVGSSVLDDVLKVADETDSQVILTPAEQGDGFGTESKRKLVSFYKKFGFVENKGANKDFSIGAERMYRDPVEVKYSVSGRLEGLTFPDGKVWLIDGNIEKGTAPGVFAHELGVHARKLGFKDEKSFQAILKRIEVLSKTDEQVKAARARVPDNTPAQNVNEETLAYLISDAPQHGIIQRLISVVKRFLAQRGWLRQTLDKLTPSDLQALAQSAVRADMSAVTRASEGINEPTQIKSVHNTGEWSADNPDIMMSMSAPVQEARRNTENLNTTKDGQTSTTSAEAGEKAIRSIMQTLRKVTQKTEAELEQEKGRERKFLDQYRKLSSGLEAVPIDESVNLLNGLVRQADIPDGSKKRIGQLIKSITAAKRPETQRKRLNIALETLKSDISNRFRSQIRAQVKRAAGPKHEGVIKRGRYWHEQEKDITAIREIVHNMSPEQATQAVTRVENRLDKLHDRLKNADPENAETLRNQITDAELRLHHLRTFGGLKDKSLDQLLDAKYQIEELRKLGRSTLRAVKEAWQKEIGQKTNWLAQEITGQGDPRPETVAQNNRRKQKEKSMVGRAIGAYQAVENSIQSFEHLLDRIAGKSFYTDNNGKKKARKIFQSRAVKELGSISHFATHEANRLNRESIERTQSKGLEIFGMKRSRTLVKRLQKLSKKTGKVKVTGDTLQLSPMEAAYFYSVRKEPGSEKLFKKMGFTQETWSGIDNLMTKELTAWADYLHDDLLAGVLQGETEAYRGVNGVDRVPVGLFRDDQTDIPVMNLNSAIMNRIFDANHYRAWAVPSKTFNDLFSVPETRGYIEQYAGTSTLNALDKFLEDFAKTPRELRGDMPWMDKLRSNVVMSMIGANPTTFFKQLTSIPAYAADIPTAAFVKNFAHGLGNFGAVRRMIKDSQMAQERFGSGYDRDIHEASKATAEQVIGGKVTRMRDILMAMTKLGDRAAVYAGYTVYKYHYDKNRGSKGHEEAHRIGIEEFERATERTQQAAGVKDRGSFERGSSLQKLLTMYMSSPAAYTRQTMAALRHFKTDPVGSSKRLLLFNVMLPMAFQAVASGFVGASGDDDEQWEEFWAKELRAVALGPFLGLPIARDIAAGLWDSAMGEWYGSDVQHSPVTETTQSLTQAVFHASKGLREFDDEAIEKAKGELLDFLGYAAGLPIKPGRRLKEGWDDFLSGDTEHPGLAALGWSRAARDERYLGD